MAWIIMEACAAGDWRRTVLGPLDFEWQKGESWTISGGNGAGKSALAALWVGRLDVVAGRIVRSPEWVRAEEAWISFERQRLLLEWERHIDMTDVMESPDPGTLVETFVVDPTVLALFGLAEKSKRGLKHLSTGELRRACWARAWVLGLPFIILDEPFEGLDRDGVRLLSDLVIRCRTEGRDVAFLTRRPEDVPPGNWRSLALPGRHEAPAVVTRRPFDGPASTNSLPVLEFKNVKAGYPGVPVLTDFTWTVARGDRWLVTGPNGSGKSTLLSLIFGDHPQVFSNDIRLFGLRRGPELTLSELRQRVAMVSYAAHLGFRNLFGVTGLEVVASGFAGTIGLWTEPSWEQVASCRQLVEEWGLSSSSERPWDELSWGTQRMLLLARALVSNPEILLLDEPCQGLDSFGRDHVLDRVATWCQDRSRTLIYVTHRTDEVEADQFLPLRLPVLGVCRT